MEPILKEEQGERRGSLIPLILALLFPLLLLFLALPEQTARLSTLRDSGARLSSAVGSIKEKELDGLTVVRKIYRLSPGTMAPVPDPEGYGLATDGKEIMALLDRAAPLLNGRESIFRADTPFLPETGIRYYCDQSILALVWHQRTTDSNGVSTVVTFSEVFLSDASQFRRKLSDDVFGAGAHKFPTDMALSVNAVLAASGDFYRFRAPGFCVFEGKLCKLNTERKIDTCAVDRNGDLLFIPGGTIATEEEANAFISEHGVDFTLSFGPIMIEAHAPVRNSYYALGEANLPYPRCCIAQDGSLHYLVAVTKDSMTVADFTDYMMQTGVERCYALDGGQTGTIVMEGSALNPSIYGFGNSAQRAQSDIIYFASAIPKSERGN